MADADLYRIKELPSDPIGGGSGEKRLFSLQFIGKIPNERFPYTIANEVVSSYLGTVLGFNIPAVIPHIIDGSPQALVLWMEPAAKQQVGPPLTSKKLRDFVESHAEEVHGAIVLDLFLANTDRSFGPVRRNISIDDRGRLLLFDFGNSLFYRHREHEGIEAGIPRLSAVEAEMKQMFDKKEKDAENYYFQLLESPAMVNLWCDRIKLLPEYVIDNAIRRIPAEVLPPNDDEREALAAFLKRRQHYLRDQIYDNQHLFPGLKIENQT